MEVRDIVVVVGCGVWCCVGKLVFEGRLACCEAGTEDVAAG